MSREMESPFLQLEVDATNQHEEPAQLFEAEFRSDQLPVAVRQKFALGKTQWKAAVTAAIRAGIKDTRRLADLIFFMQHPERMDAGQGRLIATNDTDFHRTRAEWILYRTIASGMLDSQASCPVFLPAIKSADYEKRVAAATTGKLIPLLHGRNWAGNKPNADKTESFDSMQRAVESLGRGDTLFLATWQFKPFDIELTTTSATGAANWGEMLKRKAEAGVRMRIIMSDFPSQGLGFKSNIAALEKLVTELSPDAKDNFKYIVSMHPARLFFKEIGTHHQKFMVVRRRGSLTAFCGGLDIAGPRSPRFWSPQGWIWHDLHARLEGRIVYDLDREFVERWNREKAGTTAGKLSGWKDFETLTPAPLAAADKTSAKNSQRLQMHRTVAVGPADGDIRRDDIWQGYFRLIGCARRFIYMENQYLREPLLAEAIVKMAEARPELIVMVVVTQLSDDPDNPLTDHGRFLQHQFFSILKAGIPAARRRFYTMSNRLVHTKLMLVDDRAASLGSANGNPRGFFLDSELNVMLDDKSATRHLRLQQWSLDLGLDPTKVASFTVPQFFARWDAIANANDALRATPEEMQGSGVLPYDPDAVKGKETAGFPAVLTET